MSVKEIETAITQLPSPELTRLAAWFAEYQADLWDQQIEQDALAGRLDKLVTLVVTPRPYGLAEGEFQVLDDFDAALPEDVLRDFER